MTSTRRQADYHLRETDQDRERVPTNAEIYDLVRGGLETCNCWDDCLTPTAAWVAIGSMTSIVDTAWAYRWSFTFTASDADYYAFMQDESPIVLTWDGLSKWISDDVAGPCPGGAGGETPNYRWELAFSSASVDPGVFTLSLVRYGGSGTCDEWVDLVYENFRPFDPLCPNQMRPAERGLISPYSAGLSCLICLVPTVTTITVDCLSESLNVPQFLGIDPGAPMESGCDFSDYTSGDIIPFENTGEGCVWNWGTGPYLVGGACADLMIEWTATLEIVDAGGGDVYIEFIITAETTTATMCATELTRTLTYHSANIALEDVADALLGAITLNQVSDVGDTATLCVAQFAFDDPLTLTPL